MISVKNERQKNTYMYDMISERRMIERPKYMYMHDVISERRMKEKDARVISERRYNVHVWRWQKGKDKDGILCTLAWTTKAKLSNYGLIVDGSTKLWLWDIRVELSIDTWIQKNSDAFNNLICLKLKNTFWFDITRTD